MGFIIHSDKTVMILYELACSQTVLCKEKKLENKNVCLKVDSAPDPRVFSHKLL